MNRKKDLEEEVERLRGLLSDVFAADNAHSDIVERGDTALAQRVDHLLSLAGTWCIHPPGTPAAVRRAREECARALMQALAAFGGPLS